MLMLIKKQNVFLKLLSIYLFVTRYVIINSLIIIHFLKKSLKFIKRLKLYKINK